MGPSRHRLTTALLAGLAGVAGLVLAVVMVLNLNIFLGPPDGYMSSPRDVVEHSVVLAAVDVLLLVGGPGLAVGATLRLRRDRAGEDRTEG